jgi:hypothetical protein
MSWENISEEIAEEFGSYAGKGSCDRYQDAWDFEPKLDEEVDMQEWHNHILLSRPSFSDKGGTPQTCIRISVRKWKNGHGEGKWFAASPSNSWGEQDYAYMSAMQQSTDIWSQPKPEKPMREIEAEDEAEPKTVTEIAPLLPSETKRVRVQVTMRSGGTYVAGRNGNFQLQGASGEEVVEMLRPLEVQWPPSLKPACSVRVQIQNLIGGKMSGGGNYQLHNADVPEVLTAIEGLVGRLVVERRSSVSLVPVVSLGPAISLGPMPLVPAVSLGPMPETPKATEAEGVSSVWSKWKDSKTCPNCGCGEVGSCLCKALAEAKR